MLSFCGFWTAVAAFLLALSGSLTTTPALAVSGDLNGFRLFERCFERGRAMMAGDAAAWMLENLLQRIAEEEITRQHFSVPTLMYRMQNQQLQQQFPQRAKKALMDEDVTMDMEPNIQVRPVREGLRYLLWRKITG